MEENANITFAQIICFKIQNVLEDNRPLLKSNSNHFHVTIIAGKLFHALKTVRRHKRSTNQH